MSREAPAPVHPGSPARRAGLAGRTAGVVVAVSAATVLLTLVPAAAGPLGAGLRGVVLALFWLTAPGTVVASRLRLAPMTRVAQVPLLGLVLAIGVSAAGTAADLWVPRTAVVVVAIATGGVALATTRAGARAGWWAVMRSCRSWPTSDVVLVLACALAALLWAAAVPRVLEAPSSVFGLLASGPWALPAAILAAAVVLLVALGRRSTRATVAAAVVLLTALRATATVAVSAPAASWTYKHLVVTGFLQAEHHIPASGDIYLNWPGMFTAAGWFADASGLGTTDLARWWPPVIQAVIMLQAAALARALGSRAPGCAAAAGIAVVINWVAQDYYSPQSVAMCLGSGVVVLLVQSRRSRTCAVLALVLFAAIVPTHQLTPAWLILVTASLFVLRRTPWWVPAAMIAMFAGYVGAHYGVVAHYGLFSGADITANAQSNVAASDVIGRRVGGIVAKATFLLTWGAAAVVLLARALRLRGVRRVWRARSVMVPAVLSFASVALLAGQSYGGEAILRVTLYSTVGCAAVLGPALARAMTRRSTALVAAAWTLVLTASAAQATYGTWFVNLMRPEDLSASAMLTHDVPRASTVISATPDWPGTLPRDYLAYAALDSADAQRPSSLLAAAQALQGGSTEAVSLSPTLAREVVAAHGRRPAYLVLTSSMRASGDYYGFLQPGSLDRLRRRLQASDDWKVVRHHGDLWVFQYTAPGWPTS